MQPAFMIDLETTHLTSAEEEFLTLPQVGAIILFGKNFTDREQLIQLVKEIRAINPAMIITTDHEGGFIQRFQRHGFHAIPAPHVYGRLYDNDPAAALKLAFDYGYISAKDLLDCGINLSLAPVLDLHGDNPVIGKLERAFHADPDVVIQLAGAYINGMHQAGMATVGKHFPGHGTCALDSHIDKPVCDKTLEALLSSDLKPFVELIKQQKLDYVMPAHVRYPEIDSENPAGFSKIWLQQILRDKLDFKGAIMSDCINMSAAEEGDLTSRATRAFTAGCNIVTVTNLHKQPWPELRAFIQDFHLG